CQSGACLPPCGDDDPCTQDFCWGFCIHYDTLCPTSCSGLADGTACSDDSVCTTGRCESEQCVASPVVCESSPCRFYTGDCLSFYECGYLAGCADDGNPCTIDLCNPDEGCVHLLAPAGT